MSNRKEASKQHPSGELNEELDLLCRGHFSKKDNFENVKEWVYSGEYNVKLFAKLLPHTANDISQGRVTFEMISDSLSSTVVWLTNRDDTVRLRHLSRVLADVILPESASSFLRVAIMMHLARMIYFKSYSTGQGASVVGIQSSLSEVIRGVRSYYISEKGINAMVQDSDGNFLRECPVHKLTETDFVNAVLDKTGEIDTGELWRECEEMRRTGNVFFRVTLQLHSTFYECWECSKVFENVFHCSGCKAAAYCGKKCQGKAWKGGHKVKCCRLKPMHKVYRTGVEEAEKAHVTGILDGFELCPLSDSMMLNQCLLLASDQKSGPSGRSMKNFYANLGRIIRGEWWVYDMSDKTKGTRSATVDPRPCDKYKVLSGLTMDWFGSVGTDDPQAVTASTDPFFRRVCGPPISAKELLEHYVSPPETPEQGQRLSVTLSSYKFLRKLYGEMK